MQAGLFETTPRFDGVTVTLADTARLTGQLAKVEALMLDGQWRTLAQIAYLVEGSEAGVSARLRDLRKVRFGAYTVEHRHLGHGLWVYRVTR
jgi:hypothetical protein